MKTILAVMALCAFSCRTPEQASFFVDADLRLAKIHHAELDSKSKEELPSGFLIAGHEVMKGQGRVFQFVQRHDSRRGTESTYTEELSIYIPAKIPAEMSIDLSDRTGDVIVFYSTFNDAFLGNSGCFGYATNGKLSIRKDGEDWSVTIDSTFARKDPVGLGARCGDVHVDGSYRTKLKSLASS